jgi:hypothetical protein
MLLTAVVQWKSVSYPSIHSSILHGVLVGGGSLTLAHNFLRRGKGVEGKGQFMYGNIGVRP